MNTNFISTVYEDVVTLKEWAFNSNPPAEVDKGIRVEIAALRTFCVLGMAFASLWVFSEVAAIITYPLKLAINLAVPAIMVVVLRDIFVICQNATAKELDKNEAGMWGMLIALASYKQDDAFEITKDTVMQPVWMWVHAKSGLILLKP